MMLCKAKLLFLLEQMLVKFMLIQEMIAYQSKMSHLKLLLYYLIKEILVNLQLQ